MSLTRILNKTPLANEKSNIYEVDNIDSKLISQILQSRFIGEGVFTIEQYSIDDYKERYLVNPSFQKYPLHISNKQWNFQNGLNEVIAYELVLDKPSFLPLDISQFADVFNVNLNSPAFIQVLICKRVDEWRENAIHQYTSFLKGNNNPLDGKFAIRMQEKVLNVLSKIGNFQFKREQIEEIESKILSNNYRFECRILLFEQKSVDKTILELQKLLQKLQLFNEIKVKKVNNKKSFIRLVENREFRSELVNQMLSEAEVYSLLCRDKPSTITKIELETPIKQQFVTKNIEDSMLLQRAIQLMPKGENRNIEIDQSKADQINQAFKRVGIVKKPMKVTEMYQGSSLLKVQMEVPTDITYTSITKKLTDIKAALGNEGVSIEIGDKPDSVNVFLPLEERGVLYFRDVLDSEGFQEFKQSNVLPFIIGEDVDGNYMFACLSKLRHLLIAGTSGSGKSVSLTLILLSLLLNVPPKELYLYLIDPKMVELTMFKGFPQTQEIITDMKKATTLLDKLCFEMDNRYELMAKRNVREIAVYNQKSEIKLPYIVTAIDELADLMMVNSSVEDHIVRIAQKGRAAGMHLILATQRPSVDVVTGLIKANMPARIAYKTTSGVDSKTILDTVGAEKLLGLGDCLVKIEGNPKELIRVQSPILTLNKVDEEWIYDELKRLFSDIEIVKNELPEAESEIDKLKRTIADNGELRVSELGRLMGIGNNKVHALMQELLEEEWLRKEGRSYEVNISQEELENWKSGI